MIAIAHALSPRLVSLEKFLADVGDFDSKSNAHTGSDGRVCNSPWTLVAAFVAQRTWSNLQVVGCLVAFE